MTEIGSYEVDYQSGALTWSEQLFRVFGLAHTPTGMAIDQARALLPHSDATALRHLADRVRREGRPGGLVHRYRRGDELRFAEQRLEPLFDPDGHAYGVRGTLQDITERRSAEHEIHLQAHLLDAVDVAVVASDADGAVTHFNAGAERLLRRPREEVLGRPVTGLAGTGDADEATGAILEHIQRTGQWEGDLEIRRRDGTHFPGYVRAALFADPDGARAGMVAVCVDVSERAETERQLRAAGDYQRAITDSMAEGLYTMDADGRLLYLNRAGEKLLGWRSDELAGKVVHDHVHDRRPDGSRAPAEECPLLRAGRAYEVVRLADDVFIRRDGTALPVEITASPIETADGVRGSVVVFSDITERKARELALERRLESASWAGQIRAALAEDRFVIHAQPIIDVATGAVVRHELLIRMVDADGTIIAPGRFLPTAEESGLIVEIDRWVVREAIALAAAGHPVELNLSAHSLGAPGVLADLRDGLARTGADPSLLVVEITETALIQDGEAAERFLARLRDLGCKLALDDFGTGYGGLTYLKRLPVDYLKIDIEFVRDVVHNTASQEVVRAVVGLAHAFGQRTVAEGVEDDATLALLAEIGVDRAQGYGIARPAPVADVLAGRAGRAG